MLGDRGKGDASPVGLYVGRRVASRQPVGRALRVKVEQRLFDLSAFAVKFADLDIVDQTGNAVNTIDGVDGLSIILDKTAVADLGRRSTRW